MNSSATVWIETLADSPLYHLARGLARSHARRQGPDGDFRRGNIGAATGRVEQDVWITQHEGRSPCGEASILRQSIRLVRREVRLSDPGRHATQLLAATLLAALLDTGQGAQHRHVFGHRQGDELID